MKSVREMRRSLRRAGALVLIAAGSLTAARAQVTNGTILGTVTDTSGAVIQGATVQVVETGTGMSRTTTTNGSGLYTEPSLLPGNYRLTVKASGFSTSIVQRVIVTVAAQKEVNIVLKPGATSNQVVVQSSLSTIDLASSTIQPVVDSKTIVQLPLNGRDWTQLAELQPGVNPVRTQSALGLNNQRANRGVGNQITIGGSRPQGNNYRIDGISINDYSNGGPGGVLGQNLGVDAIQEFSVITSTPTADYGKTSGGVVNAVTRSGANAFHGDVYEFLRNSALDARNEFDLPGKIAPFRRNQFGGALGGPIVRNKAFFFGNYEGLRQNQSANVSSVVPSAAARAGDLSSGTIAVDPAVKPFLQFYPLPNSGVSGDTGNFLFNDPTSASENYFTIRADNKLSAADTLSGTYFWDSGTIDSPDPFNVVVNGNVAKRQMAMVSESHIFSASVLNSARFGFSRSVSVAPTPLRAINPAASNPAYGFVPGENAGLINIGGLSNFQGGMGAVGEYAFHFNSYQFYDDLYWTRGKHQLKFGFSFERMQNNQLGTANPNGQFIFGSLQAFLQNQPTSFNAPITKTTVPVDLRQSVLGFYVMDDYHMLSNLTLNLGLRYEPATIPTQTNGEQVSNLPSLTASAPRLGGGYFLSNPTLKDFAPRIGMAWDPRKNGKTVVRAAYGIYDNLPLDYLFEGLSILTAPHLEFGNAVNLPPGTFPSAAFGFLTRNKLRYSYVQPNPSRGYVEQYNVNIEHQLSSTVTAEVGYVGNHGVHLPYRLDDVNTVQPVSTQGGYFFPVPRGSGTLLNPNVGQISALFFTNSSTYNSLQASLRQQFTRNLQFTASYTWAKAMDYGSSSIFGDTFANSISSLAMWLAPSRRRAVSDFDVAQNLTFSYVYQLPQKKSGSLKWVVNGWQYGGIFQVASGLPFTPLVAGDPLGLNSGDPFDFPNRIQGPGCSGNAVNKQNRAHYIKTQCFTFPNPSTSLGNAGRNSLFGPGLNDFDMSFVKNTAIPAISKTFNAQFRAEFFNIFNRVNYATPLKTSTFLFSQTGQPLASAGALTQTAGSSRQLQFALKLNF